MKSIRYTLLISVIFCFVALGHAQTNRSDSTKMKKSSPVPARPVTPAPSSTSTPAVVPNNGAKKSSPVPRISKQSPAPAYNSSNPRTTTAPTNNATNGTTTNTVDPNRPVGNGMFNLGLVAGIPQGQFATNTNNDWSWGADIGLLFNLGQKKPKREWADQMLNLYMGGRLEFLYQAGKNDTYKYNDQFSETTIDSKVSNSMWGFGFITRAEFLSGVVKPFVELSAGLRFFNGSHTVNYTNSLYYSTDPADTRKKTFSNHLQTSPVGYYAAAGGLRIGSEKVRLELKVTYLKGSTAEYVDMQTIQFDRTDNSIYYTTKKSTTDMIMPQLGVSFIF